MMNREYRCSALVAALLTLLTPACGSSPSAPTTTGPFAVSGQVFNIQTGAGVAGATVIFADPGNTTTITGIGQAVANSSGSYQLSLMARQYAVYIDQVYGGQVLVRTAVNRIDLFVHQTGCIARYGTIGDSRTGAVIAGATVSMLGVTVTTGADGVYRLDYGCRSGLWSNTIGVTVTKAGYQDGGVPMGRGEGFDCVIRQDVDLDPR